MSNLLVTATTLFSVAQAVKQINDIKKYPACLEDSDCETRHKLQDHACFQYFCYPWKKTAVTASAKPKPLNECRRNKDCASGAAPNQRQKCFRHHDKRKITSGICVDSFDDCDSHDECIGKGGKCCNGYCCNGDYFEAIKSFPCSTDLGCEVSITLSLILRQTTEKKTGFVWERGNDAQNECQAEKMTTGALNSKKDFSNPLHSKVQKRVFPLGVGSFVLRKYNDSHSFESAEFLSKALVNWPGHVFVYLAIYLQLFY